MSDYSVAAFGETYVSTLTAGVLGIMLVLVATLVLGAAITKQKQTRNEKS
jgi:Co/Zn/Cd efflux system component